MTGKIRYFLPYTIVDILLRTTFITEDKLTLKLSADGITVNQMSPSRERMIYINIPSDDIVDINYPLNKEMFITIDRREMYPLFKKLDKDSSIIMRIDTDVNKISLVSYGALAEDELIFKLWSIEGHNFFENKILKTPDTTTIEVGYNVLKEIQKKLVSFKKHFEVIKFIVNESDGLQLLLDEFDKKYVKRIDSESLGISGEDAESMYDLDYIVSFLKETYNSIKESKMTISLATDSPITFKFTPDGTETEIKYIVAPKRRYS